MHLHDVKRECLRMCRHPMAVLLPTLFYMVVLILFLFIDTPDSALWSQLLPRIILVPAFLAMFMVATECFSEDYQTGYLSYYLFGERGGVQRIAVRLLSLGLLYLIPLIALCGVFSWVMGLPLAMSTALITALGLALPTLFLMAAFAGALTLALPQAAILQAVILMPLYIPVLLFSQSLIMRAQMGLEYLAFVYLLLAILLLVLVFFPILIVITLKWAYE